MKYKFIKSKMFLGNSVSISFAFLSICAVMFMQNCSYGSKVESRQVAALKLPYTGSQWGPDMVYIEGGSVATGGRFGSPFSSGGSDSKVVTVSAFYMSRAPVTNRDYMKYLDDLIRSSRYKEYKEALPNVAVWKKNSFLTTVLKSILLLGCS